MSHGAWALIAMVTAAVASVVAFVTLPEPKLVSSTGHARSRPAPQSRDAKPAPQVVLKPDGALPPAAPERPAAVAAPPGVEAPPTPEQRLFELEQRFEQDALPDARAHQVGREVRVELERVLEGTGSLRAVDCKLKTCRAMLSLPGMDADKAMFRRILNATEGPFSSFAMRVERKVGVDGEVETSLFFFL